MFPLFIFFTDNIQYTQVAYNFFPGKKQRVLRVVNMGWFAAGAVEFKNGKIASCTKIFPVVEFDVQPAKLKTRNSIT
jgi:hypothetical protein